MTKLDSHQTYGLLIASITVIVALVGVMLFIADKSSPSTAAIIYYSDDIKEDNYKQIGAEIAFLCNQALSSAESAGYSVYNSDFDECHRWGLSYRLGTTEMRNYILTQGPYFEGCNQRCQEFNDDICTHYCREGTRGY